MTGRKTSRISSSKLPLACVMGSMDLVRPLGLSNIRSAVVARPGAPSLYSRFTQGTLCREDFSPGDEGLVDALLRFAADQPQPPVLFYEEDAQLLLISRHRRRLAQAFRFVIADPDLVETLVDKARFYALAEQLGLPVPATRILRPGASADVDLHFPIIVKPLVRSPSWDAVADGHKALQFESQEALNDAWPRLGQLRGDLIAQEFIPGPESRIESYHVYVDETGAIAGEFTGRKIRTYPVSCGHSTALEITRADDLLVYGRAVVRALKLRGVAKLDFKRGPNGGLFLLEVNPRFNLWHHLGAVAGVNLPAMVYADLLGLARPKVTTARAGARWCCAWKDLPAALAARVPLWRWMLFLLGCEAKSAISWDDPMPLLRSILFRFLPRRTGSSSPLQMQRQFG